jgi:hypothetical protein
MKSPRDIGLEHDYVELKLRGKLQQIYVMETPKGRKPKWEDVVFRCPTYEEFRKQFFKEYFKMRYKVKTVRINDKK